MRLLWCVVVLVAACTSSSDPGEPQVTSGAIRKQIPMSVNRRVDVLFVIDNSPAMAPYTQRLATNVARFVEKLRAPSIPDIRLAVTTTDADGNFHGTNGVTGNFIVDFVGSDGNRQRNYDGDFADVVARMVDVGTTGGAPQPFAAARRALEKNDLFWRRRDAFQAVFFITAGDAPDDTTGIYAAEQFFKALQPDWQKMIFGAVVGGNATAIPAFLDRFPNRSWHVSIDDADWSQIWEMISQQYRTSLGSPCVEGPLLDVDLEREGEQQGCAVWYDFPVGGEVLPPCADAPDGQCWKLTRDPLYCPTTFDGEESRLLRIDRPRVDFPESVMLNLECLTR